MITAVEVSDHPPGPLITKHLLVILPFPSGCSKKTALKNDNDKQLKKLSLLASKKGGLI